MPEKSLHPPYEVPYLWRFAQYPQSPDVYNVRVTANRFSTGLCLDVSATFVDLYGAPAGIPIAFYWQEWEVAKRPVQYLRVADKSVRFTEGGTDLDALDLEEDLSDNLIEALDELVAIYDQAVLVMKEYLEGANEYAIARLDRAAQARSKPPR